jgi:hypothetical protein
MPLTYRILIAAAILLIDGILFFFPLGALLLAYVLVANPPWFCRLVDGSGRPDPAGPVS